MLVRIIFSCSPNSARIKYDTVLLIDKFVNYMDLNSLARKLSSEDK